MEEKDRGAAVSICLIESAQFNGKTMISTVDDIVLVSTPTPVVVQLEKNRKQSYEFYLQKLIKVSICLTL